MKRNNMCLSYLYDGNLLLAEKVGNKITKYYINDGQGIIGIVRPIYNESDTLTHYQRLYFLYDTLGSVSCVTGENGLPLQNYTYSPFGTCLNVTNDPINSLQFIGRYGGYLDSDTGLTYFWHRWYDSRDGRWISRDPVNVAGGINLYGYAKNNPGFWKDSDGLCPGGAEWQPAPGPTNKSSTSPSVTDTSDYGPKYPTPPLDKSPSVQPQNPSIRPCNGFKINWQAFAGCFVASTLGCYAIFGETGAVLTRVNGVVLVVTVSFCTITPAIMCALIATERY
jgi:RHS repeat-associated protein